MNWLPNLRDILGDPPGLLKERYGIEEEGKKPYGLLDEIATGACMPDKGRRE